MKEENPTLSAIDRKLTIVIALLHKIAHEESNFNLKEQIAELAALGLNSSEIAPILGKKIGYISKEMSALKKQ